MKNIPGYMKFINEKKVYDNDYFEINQILNQMLDVPIEKILIFRNDLKLKLMEDDKLIKESINLNYLKDLKHKFRRWFTDKLFDYLINRKKSYYEKLVDKLNIFDLYNLDDVYKHFPTFELKSMYLAGGMDAAKKGGKVGWRNIVEYELEINRPGNKKNNPNIQIYLGENGENVVEVSPSYVIDDVMLDFFIENTRKCLNLYNYPAILNPVRKEVDRNKIDFEKYLVTLKKANSTQEEIDNSILYFRDLVSKKIAYEDEIIINKSDAIFLGLNAVGGAGTYAELQLLSFIEKPLFCVLVEGYENIVGNFKLWNMPQLCKLARNKSEMIDLIDTLHIYANK